MARYRSFHRTVAASLQRTQCTRQRRGQADQRKIEELRRSKTQDALANEWAAKAQVLLNHPKLNLADAMAWSRDAAKAGAPLSREPLSGLRLALADLVKHIEDLAHRAQVLRESALLMAQRIEVLSTKP